MGQTRVLSARLKVVFLTIVIPTAVMTSRDALELVIERQNLDQNW
jgi:hypothetical protein